MHPVAKSGSPTTTTTTTKLPVRDTKLNSV